MNESQSRYRDLMDQYEELVRSHTVQPSSDEKGTDTVTTATIKQLRKVDLERSYWEIRHKEVFQRCQSTEVELEETKQRLDQSKRTLAELRNVYSGRSGESDRALNEARNEAAAYKDSNDKLRRDLEELKKRRDVLEEEIRTKNAESEPLTCKLRLRH